MSHVQLEFQSLEVKLLNMSKRHQSSLMQFMNKRLKQTSGSSTISTASTTTITANSTTTSTSTAAGRSMILILKLINKRLINIILSCLHRLSNLSLLYIERDLSSKLWKELDQLVIEFAKL